MTRPEPVTISGVTFPSLREAARANGVEYATLRNRLRRGVAARKLVSPDNLRVYKRKTHCKRGHLLDDLNVLIYDVKGYILRQCRACHRERVARLYQQKRAKKVTPA